MTSENFCNWLQGYLELASPGEIRAEEIKVIRDHLVLVKNPNTAERPPYAYEKEVTDKVKPKYC